MKLDYRLPENRREGLIHWFVSSFAEGDADGYIYVLNYLNHKRNEPMEGRYWFAWIMHTYQLATTLIHKETFPVLSEIDDDAFSDWTRENFHRIRYSRDTQWNKGHMPAMLRSYKEWLGGKTQEERFAEFVGNDEYETFDNVWREVLKNFYKFGGNSAWYYLQTVKHTCGLPMEPRNYQLKDYAGRKSIRDGLLIALNKEDWIGQRLTPGEYEWLEDSCKDILCEVHARFPNMKTQLDAFAFETALCAYKKLMQTRKTMYLGYYLDRQAFEIREAEENGWDNVNWNQVWTLREDIVGGDMGHRDRTLDDKYMEIFRTTGHYQCDLPCGTGETPLPAQMLAYSTAEQAMLKLDSRLKLKA